MPIFPCRRASYFGVGKRAQIVGFERVSLNPKNAGVSDGKSISRLNLDSVQPGFLGVRRCGHFVLACFGNSFLILLNRHRLHLFHVGDIARVKSEGS